VVSLRLNYVIDTIKGHCFR